MSTPKIIPNYLLKHIAAIGIGGSASYFSTYRSISQLVYLIHWANCRQIPFHIVGGCTNVIPTDRRLNGLVIKNDIQEFKVRGHKIVIGAGNNLLKTIVYLNRLGISGMERMMGIPGTIGGALYGCAGAYGQEIKDHLLRVQYFDGIRTQWIHNRDIQFAYRDSIFKRKPWVIINAEFSFGKENPRRLMKISREIVKLREHKYKKGMKCPGSFFKNIPVLSLDPKLRNRFLQKVDNTKIIFGKVPAGYLLESVGANGMELGDIAIATNHGNLIYNKGNGTAKDVLKLAEILKRRVKKKFLVDLEEEVEYLS